MKKALIFLIFVFAIYTVFACFCPYVTMWDRSVIVAIQEGLKDIPSWVPLMFDCKLYALSILLPLVIGIIFFLKKYYIFDALFIGVAPLIPFVVNHVFKGIMQRPRPPLELQMVHPGNFSYVSSHTLISFCLWGLIIYYLNEYCTNKFLRIVGIALSVLWIIAIGFSRVWLGVHNPTDVIGAYILGGIILILYIQTAKILGGKYPS